MTVGHNRWHEKIVCCLDMLILRPYIKWRVWSTLDTLIHITSLGTMTTTSNIPQIYLICSTRLNSTQLDPPKDLSFEFNAFQCSLDGIKFQIFVYTREMIDGNAEKLCLVSSQVCSVSGANELLMGWVCLAPGDRQETGDCPRHGHQWSRDTWCWLTCHDMDRVLPGSQHCPVPAALSLMTSYRPDHC